jgi:tetratricopeptide (TPR) repeat protein
MRKNPIAALMLGVLLFVLGVLPVRAQPPQPTVFEKTTLVLKKMRDEKISAQKAFDDGILTKEILLSALEEDGVLDAQPDQWQSKLETLAWTQLLVEKFPEAVAKPAEFPANLQIKIARWYFSKNDKHGAEILEEILKNMSREKPDENVVNNVIYLLAEYYASVGETEKSIATSLKAKEFTTDPVVLARYIWFAARTAAAAGNTGQAQQFYEQVIAVGDEKTQATIELSQVLSRDGRWDEARELLKKPVEGENADINRIELDNELIESYFNNGEWGESLKWAKTTVEHYDTFTKDGLKEFPKWVVEIVEDARQMPEQIAKWQKNPLATSVQQIEMQVPTTEAERAVFEKRKSFMIYSYPAGTPSVVSDNPQLKVAVKPLPREFRGSSNYRTITFDFAPEALKTGLRAEIIITCAEFPDITLRVPVTLKEAAP